MIQSLNSYYVNWRLLVVQAYLTLLKVLMIVTRMSCVFTMNTAASVYFYIAIVKIQGLTFHRRIKGVSVTPTSVLDK